MILLPINNLFLNKHMSEIRVDDENETLSDLSEPI